MSPEYPDRDQPLRGTQPEPSTQNRLTDRPSVPRTEQGPRSWGFLCKNQGRPREIGTSESPGITKRFESDADGVEEGMGAGGKGRVGVIRKLLPSRTPESPGLRTALRALGTHGEGGAAGLGEAVTEPVPHGRVPPTPEGGSYAWQADTPGRRCEVCTPAKKMK